MARREEGAGKRVGPRAQRGGGAGAGASAGSGGGVGAGAGAGASAGSDAGVGVEVGAGPGAGLGVEQDLAIVADGLRSRESLSTRELVLAALFAAATAVLAYVRIPIPLGPVPITGQSFGFMLAGMLLGPGLGAMSIFVYVLMGVIGLPVFSGGTAGIGILLGPTGGYLWGGIAGAWVAGLITGGAGRPGFTYVKALAAAVVGGIVVGYTAGVGQLAFVTGLGWREALLAGAVPFLLGDGFKAAVAAGVAVRLAPLMGRGVR